MITAEQIAQLDESDIEALRGSVGLAQGDYKLLDDALSLKRNAGPQATPAELDRAEGNLSKQRNLSRAKEEGALAEKNYESAAMGNKYQQGEEAPQPFSPYAPPPSPPMDPQVKRAFTKQAIGTAAATAQMIPGVDAVTTGLAGKPVLEEAVQESPSPTASRGWGIVAGYLLARGGGAAGNVIAAPYTAPYKAIAAGVKKVLPKSTALPHLAGGAGSAGLVAGAEAGAKRQAQALAGNEVEPFSASEVTIPMAFGAGIATMPALAAALRNPNSEKGQIAQRFVNAHKSGTAKDVEAEIRNNPIEGKALPEPMDRAKREYEVSVGKTALKTEPEFSTAHNAAEREWMDNQFAPRFADIERKLKSEGRVSNPQATIDDLRELASTKASQSNEGQQLSIGASIEELANKLEPYLGPGATVRDYKNAIDDVTNLANRNRVSKVAEQVYKDAEKIIRRDAYRAFPEYEKLAEEHKTFQDNQERLTALVYGKESHQQEDFAGVAPEARGRKFFKSLASGTPDAEAAAEELGNRADYGKAAVGQMKESERVATKRFGEREALDRSSWRPGSDWAHGGALMAEGGMSHSPTRVPMAIRGALRTLPPRQFFRSRAAKALPPEVLEQIAQRTMLMLPAMSGPAAFEGLNLIDKTRKRISER